MKTAFALFFYASALFLLWQGFNVPGAEGLNHHITPRTDAELASAALILFGCIAKLAGHVTLFATARAR